MDRATILVGALACALLSTALFTEAGFAQTPIPLAAPVGFSSATAAQAPAMCAASLVTFTGDPTGSTDVTDALRAFLQSHDGERVALAENGIYAVTLLSFTAHDLTVDFRGSRLQGIEPGAHGILRVQSSSNVVLNDPMVYGTGYAWVRAYEFEHGIHIDGGSDITLNRPVTRRTRGDGIYVGYQGDKNEPAARVIINAPDIKRASRNGIAPVAGEVTILGGRIDRVGLHGVDFEPNDETGAASIRGTVDGIDIRRHGDLPTGIRSYAIAAVGKIRELKPYVRVTNVTGARLRMSIRDTASVEVRGNISRKRTTADFPGSESITFVDNVRIRRP